jgi:hypothetical protein
MRSTRDVLECHLALRRKGDLEEDIARNYGDDLVVIAKDGVFHGADGIRTTASILHANLPDAEYDFDLLEVSDKYALLGWSARAADGTRSSHGADAFVVEDGRIAVQMIHYEVDRD